MKERQIIDKVPVMHRLTIVSELPNEMDGVRSTAARVALSVSVEEEECDDDHDEISPSFSWRFDD